MRLHLIVQCLGLAVAASGCAWRGQSADHLYGPALYRERAGGAMTGSLTETIHAPVLFEAGRQWGLSLGLNRQLTLKPVVRTRGPDDAHDARWRWSILYKRLPHHATPVFHARRFVGLTGVAGGAYSGLTAGYAQVTRTIPEDGYQYEIEYFSTNPLRSALRRRGCHSNENHDNTNTNPH